MNIREQLHKARYGPICNIGGDKNQKTLNSATNYDNRSVLTDSQNTYDLSNRSTSYTTDASSTAWADSSNSNNSYDLSNRSVNNAFTSTTDARTTITTDGGAVAGALSFAGGALTGTAAAVKDALGFAQSVASGQQAATIHAYDFADGLFDTSLDAVNKNTGRAYDAFDRAALIQKDALTMTGAASREALAQVQNAYADAKGTTQSQQKIMLGVLAVAAVAVLARARG